MRFLQPFALLLLAVLVIVGCRSLQVDLPRMTDDADWLTEGDDLGRLQVADVSLGAPLVEAWMYNAEAGFGPATPLLLGNTVMVANRKGDVHAIDLETGKKLGTHSFGESIEGSPVVADGVLYVPVAWGGMALRAYDLASTKQRWRVKGIPVEAGLLAHEGRLFAVNVESQVRAYDAKDGVVLWEQPLDSLASVFATPVLAGGRLIVADDRGRVVSLHAETGALGWVQQLAAPIFATPATDGEALFLASTRGRFFALDARRGTPRWTYAVRDTTVRFTAPAFDGETVFFGGSDGILRALDASTGDERWRFEVPYAFAAPPLLTRNSLFMGSMGKMLYAVDPQTGVEQWAFELKGRMKSPMAAREGYLIVLAEPRNVYLFRPEADLALSE